MIERIRWWLVRQLVGGDAAAYNVTIYGYMTTGEGQRVSIGNIVMRNYEDAPRPLNDQHTERGERE